MGFAKLNPSYRNAEVFGAGGWPPWPAVALAKVAVRGGKVMGFAKLNPSYGVRPVL